MSKSYTISGVEHLIRLLNQYPQLLSLSSMAGIREVGKKAQEAVKRSGCGCSAAPVYAQHRNIFEKALEIMSHGDHLMVKNVLKVEQICHYSKDSSGQVKLKCI